MAQINCFYVVSSEDDLIAQCATLQEGTAIAAETLQDKALQYYAPITVIMLDTSGNETRVLTIDLAK